MSLCIGFTLKGQPCKCKAVDNFRCGRHRSQPTIKNAHKILTREEISPNMHPIKGINPQEDGSVIVIIRTDNKYYDDRIVNRNIMMVGQGLKGEQGLCRENKAMMEIGRKVHVYFRIGPKMHCFQGVHSVVGWKKEGRVYVFELCSLGSPKIQDCPLM